MFGFGSHNKRQEGLIEVDSNLRWFTDKKKKDVKHNIKILKHFTDNDSIALNGQKSYISRNILLAFFQGVDKYYNAGTGNYGQMCFDEIPKHNITEINDRIRIFNNRLNVKEERQNLEKYFNNKYKNTIQTLLQFYEHYKKELFDKEYFYNHQGVFTTNELERARNLGLLIERKELGVITKLTELLRTLSKLKERANNLENEKFSNLLKEVELLTFLVHTKDSNNYLENILLHEAMALQRGDINKFKEFYAKEIAITQAIDHDTEYKSSKIRSYSTRMVALKILIVLAFMTGSLKGYGEQTAMHQGLQKTEMVVDSEDQLNEEVEKGIKILLESGVFLSMINVANQDLNFIEQKGVNKFIQFATSFRDNLQGSNLKIGKEVDKIELNRLFDAYITDNSFCSKMAELVSIFGNSQVLVTNKQAFNGIILFSHSIKFQTIFKKYLRKYNMNNLVGNETDYIFSTIISSRNAHTIQYDFEKYKSKRKEYIKQVEEVFNVLQKDQYSPKFISDILNIILKSDQILKNNLFYLITNNDVTNFDRYGKISDLRNNLDIQNQNVLFFGAKADFSGAASIDHLDIVNQLNKNNKVGLFEVADTDDLMNKLSRVSDASIDTTIIFGHGNTDLITLGFTNAGDLVGDKLSKDERAKYLRDNDKAYIDMNDDSEISQFARVMKLNGVIILYSCKNGKGGASEENIANKFKQMMRKIGRNDIQLFAPLESFSTVKIENGKIKFYTALGSNVRTYIAE